MQDEAGAEPICSTRKAQRSGQLEQRSVSARSSPLFARVRPLAAPKYRYVLLSGCLHSAQKSHRIRALFAALLISEATEAWHACGVHGSDQIVSLVSMSQLGNLALLFQPANLQLTCRTKLARSASAGWSYLGGGKLDGFCINSAL